MTKTLDSKIFRTLPMKILCNRVQSVIKFFGEKKFFIRPTDPGNFHEVTRKNNFFFI